MRFLTQVELIDLTERTRKADQIAWLKANGYLFAIGANGHARVLHEYVQGRLCGINMTTATTTAQEPNWNAI